MTAAVAYPELEPYQREYILKLEAVAHWTRDLLGELAEAEGAQEMRLILGEQSDDLRAAIDAAIPPHK